MARKHSVSPNQTMLWAYEALAPEWGSPALSIAAQEAGHLSGTAGAEAPEVGEKGRAAGERSVTALRCSYSRPDHGRSAHGRGSRGRCVRHHGRRVSRLSDLV